LSYTGSGGNLVKLKLVVLLNPQVVERIKL